MNNLLEKPTQNINLGCPNPPIEPLLLKTPSSGITSATKISEFKKEKEIQKDLPKIETPISKSKFNRSEYENIEKMKEFLSEGCKEFNENFEITKYIDSGSEGTFYEGKMKKFSNGTGRKIGLKFILKQEKSDKSNQEINLHNRLKHKNIINLYAHIPIKTNSSCIVMEYGKYGNLRDLQKKLLKRKYLSETLLCYIGKQILEGLQYCHNSKIIHADIKPQNILVDELLNIKISDFSVSLNYKKFSPEDEIKLPFTGTSLYMAPEILSSKSYIKTRDCNKIDIFSFGVLLYNLAFNQFPYKLSYEDNKNYNLIYKKIMKEQLVIPPGIKCSEYFKKFLFKVLANNIKDRYSIEQALNDPWIQASKIIFEEKEKMCNLEKFTVYIVTDTIKEFNDRIHKA